jgi:hypothetical protein
MYTWHYKCRQVSRAYLKVLNLPEGSRHQEVEQGPELIDVVLEGSACMGVTSVLIVKKQALAHNLHTSVTTAWDVTWCAKQPSATSLASDHTCEQQP